jgi:hypothetical protein
MKRLVTLLMLTAILGSCASSSKLMRRGNYDAAIEKSVRKLKKNPANENEIFVLERAYMIANEQNEERIRFLKLENNPRNLPEIMHLYNQMKARQTLVRTVTPLQLSGRLVQFPYIDYDEEIINAKSGAAEYHYSQAQRLMERSEKEAYRLAYNNLITVKELAGDYKDVDFLILDARQKGISRALVGVTNRTHLNLSPEFVMQLLTVDYSSIDNRWVEFHYMDLDESLSYDYFVDINLLSILVSPDQTSEEDRMVRKRVEDGFDYVLDARGNVLKDSLGNDVKVPKYKDLACTVIETKQQKTVSIEGNIEIFSESPRRLLKREPLAAATKFEHFSARAIGDLAALDEETRKLVEIKPLTFPSEAEMVYRTAETMRVAIASAVRKNRSLIK